MATAKINMPNANAEITIVSLILVRTAFSLNSNKLELNGDVTRSARFCLMSASKFSDRR